MVNHTTVGIVAFAVMVLFIGSNETIVSITANDALTDAKVAKPTVVVDPLKIIKELFSIFFKSEWKARLPSGKGDTLTDTLKSLTAVGATIS